MRRLGGVLMVVAVMAGGGLIAGCESSDPDAVVNDFAAAYAAGDIDKACGYYEQDGSGSASDALLEAAQEDREVETEVIRALGSVEDETGVCPANLTLIHRWDPDPGRVTSVEVRDVDQNKEKATVDSSLGTWELHEVDGEWKLSNFDPVIPARLVTQ